MALEMRTACERCAAPLAHDAPAFVCSFECTFCPRCTGGMAHVCPNCGGELLARPRRGPPGAPKRAFEVAEGEFVVSDDPGRLDFGFVHASLRESYWSPGIPLDLVKRGAAHSLAVGVYQRAAEGRQVGYGRAVTDRATYAYLADIFVSPEARGRGLGALIMRAFVEHPDLQGLRRWMLLTRDAHGLYRRFGFTPAANPLSVMERWDPGVYSRLAGGGAEPKSP